MRIRQTVAIAIEAGHPKLLDFCIHESMAAMEARMFSLSAQSSDIGWEPSWGAQTPCLEFALTSSLQSGRMK
jgi:hypothetical protein